MNTDKKIEIENYTKKIFLYSKMSVFLKELIGLQNNDNYINMVNYRFNMMFDLLKDINLPKNDFENMLSYFYDSKKKYINEDNIPIKLDFINKEDKKNKENNVKYIIYKEKEDEIMNKIKEMKHKKMKAYLIQHYFDELDDLINNLNFDNETYKNIYKLYLDCKKKYNKYLKNH